MTRPIKVIDLGGGSCGLSEFISPVDVVDDDAVSESSVIQHQGAIDHAAIVNTGIATGHLPFVWEIYYTVNNSPTITTSTSLVNHLVLAAVVSGGIYRLSWSYSYSRNNTGSDVIIQLVDVGGVDGNPVDPTLVHRLQQEQKDSAGTSRIGGTGTNQESSASGFIHVNLPAAAQTFNLQVASSAGTVITSIWDARLELLRVG